MMSQVGPDARCKFTQGEQANAGADAQTKGKRRSKNWRWNLSLGATWTVSRYEPMHVRKQQQTHTENVLEQQQVRAGFSEHDRKISSAKMRPCVKVEFTSRRNPYAMGGIQTKNFTQR